MLYESVTTRKSAAKTLISRANHFLNKIRCGDINARRLASQVLFDPAAQKKVFEEIIPRYSERETTFCKLVPVSPRRGDNAPQAIVMLTRTISSGTKDKDEKK